MKNRKNGLSGVGLIVLENGKDFLRPLPTPVWGLEQVLPFPECLKSGFPAPLPIRVKKKNR